MSIKDILTIVAILLSPLIALRVEKKINEKEEKEKRKHRIFETLMSTRATPLLPEHVNALNSINIAFYHEKEIRTQWKIYLDHFESYPANQMQPLQQHWENKRQDLLVELLFAMSNYFKYDFDKVNLKKGVYFPLGHSNFLLQQEQIRNGVVKVLNGEAILNVKVVQ